MMGKINKIILGDCQEILKTFDKNGGELIMYKYLYKRKGKILSPYYNMTWRVGKVNKSDVHTRDSVHGTKVEEGLHGYVVCSFYDIWLNGLWAEPYGVLVKKEDFAQEKKYGR
jgi:hypothetical protein